MKSRNIDEIEVTGRKHMNTLKVRGTWPVLLLAIVIGLLLLSSTSAHAAAISKETMDGCVAAGGKVVGPGPVGEYWCCFTQSDGEVDCDLLEDEASGGASTPGGTVPKAVIKQPTKPRPMTPTPNLKRELNQ